jgi:hypothetical protein
MFEMHTELLLGRAKATNPSNLQVQTVPITIVQQAAAQL